ncbi:S-layer homology domain-containing protein [Paenibacillus sp. NRS-1760]|uniref:S-layer homology domain-containing protein n=1 Tax=Paenibacillus sp. NRS-1760 TaxID=3233902 RepID=UPI003D265906
MKLQFNTSKRWLALILAALLILPAANIVNANPASETLVNSGASHYNYFNNVYEHLDDENHILQTVTYEDIINLFDSEGTYVVLFGGAWSDKTQANIGFINQVAKQYGVKTIYNFDTRLDGKSLEIAETQTKEIKVGNNTFDFAEAYVELVKKYLKNLDEVLPAGDIVSYTKKDSKGAVISEGSAKKIEAPFLFVYNKKKIVSSLASTNVWNDYLTNGVLDTSKVDAYKAKVSQVFEGITSFDTINRSNSIKAAFNRNGSIINKKETVIFDESDGELVFEHVTYHQLTKILESEGNYTILFGGSWCPNTQAAIKFINEYAKKNNIDKVYFWDTKLDSGISIMDLNKDPNADPHNGIFFQTRDTNHPNANLYVDLINKYLPDIKTQYVKASNNVKYTNENGVEVIASKAQVPYLFQYNKDNKDADGNKAPILGHIELMYSWTNIQPDYVSSGLTGVNYNNYTNALNSLFARVEAKPTGLTAVKPTSSDENDGQITGTKGKALEYKLESETDYKAVTGDAITNLVPGTYNVRYASKLGYNGPHTAGIPAAVSYKAGEAVNVVVPSFIQDQAAPTGLAGVAPTTSANNDGKITGTTTALEYKLSNSLSDYIRATEPSVTDLVYGTYDVRYAAKEGYRPSPKVEVVIPAYGEEAQEAPTGLTGVSPTTIANNDGQITGTTAALEYRLDGTDAYQAATEPAITGLAAGTYNIRFAAKPGFSASPAINIVIKAFALQEQPEPSGLTGVAPTSSANNDGQITGTTTALEYKLSGAESYQAATAPSITGLSSGTYNVRFAAKEGYNAGAVLDVIVPNYVSPPSGGNNGPNPTPTPTPPAGGDNDGTAPTATITATTDAATGATVAKATAASITSLVELAKKAEAAGKTSVVELKVEATAQTKSVELSIPRKSFNEVASSTNAGVKANLGVGTVVFDAKAIESISNSAEEGDISIIITKVELTDEGKEALGDRPVYDFSVFAGTTQLTSFGGSNVQVSVPYTLKAGEDPNAVVVYYVTDAGSLETIRGKYNAGTGTVNFVTTHFSQYIVGYNKVSFKDVSDAAWYKDAALFLAARSITTGTDEDHYSPNATVTRGQFIVLLLKAYGIEPNEKETANFDDAGNTYYTNYLGAAKRLGITKGVEGNTFNPNSKITRQDLFTLLYRALEVFGELPKAETNVAVSSFSDSDQIASYASDAFKALVEGGIITGNNSKLSPKDVSTRAQVAQVLYNLLSK